MAKFLHSDLGQRSRGDVVEVTLTSGANVRLLDSPNFAKYKRGERHRYVGGLARRSPVRLAVPSSGHWHAVVDMQGLRGSTRASFRVIKASALRPLPPIQERRSALAEIADNAAELSPASNDPRYDVFVSHASEDKDTVVRPLAHALQAEGLSVWYDEFELKVGDSLRRKIDAGISQSRFGVIVISRALFGKNWAQYELDGLVTMSITGKQVLLPVWHDITKDEVIGFSPSLADKVALRTSDYGIREIAHEIAAVVTSASTSAETVEP
jgi:hypothetical protein